MDKIEENEVLFNLKSYPCRIYGDHIVSWLGILNNIASRIYPLYTYFIDGKMLGRTIKEKAGYADLGLDDHK